MSYSLDNQPDATPEGLTVPSAVRGARLGGHYVPAVNVPPCLAVRAAADLLIRYPGAAFVATYWDDGAGRRWWGLHGRTNGVSVTTVAEEYGGQGAGLYAGFRTPPSESRVTFSSLAYEVELSSWTRYLDRQGC